MVDGLVSKMVSTMGMLMARAWERGDYHAASAWARAAMAAVPPGVEYLVGEVGDYDCDERCRDCPEPGESR